MKEGGNEHLDSRSNVIFEELKLKYKDAKEFHVTHEFRIGRLSKVPFYEEELITKVYVDRKRIEW